MLEQIPTTKDISNLAFEYYKGNPAASKVLAMRETMLALGHKPSQELDEVVSTRPFLNMFVRGVALSPQSDDCKMMIFQDVAPLINAIPFQPTARKTITQLISGSLEKLLNLYVYDDASYANEYDALNRLQERCKQEIPKPSPGDRYMKLAREIIDFSRIEDCLERYTNVIGRIEVQDWSLNNPLQTS